MAAYDTACAIPRCGVNVQIWVPVQLGDRARQRHELQRLGIGVVVEGLLKKAVVSATAEITVHVLEGRVGRKWNEEIGLNLLAFN